MIILKPLDLRDIEWARILRNKYKKYFDDKEISQTDQNRWYKRYIYKKNYEFYVIVKDDKNIGTVSLLVTDKYVKIGDLITEVEDTNLFKEIIEEIDKKYKCPYMLDMTENNSYLLKIIQKMGFITKVISLYKK